jgi:hypothetical protein
MPPGLDPSVWSSTESRYLDLYVSGSSAYITRLFNFSRIPLPGCDAFSRQASTATHASVLIDDRVYEVDICEPVKSATETPTLLSVREIRNRLQAVVNDAKAKRAKGVKAKRIGALTADERDTWTAVCSPFVLQIWSLDWLMSRIVNAYWQSHLLIGRSWTRCPPRSSLSR